MHDAALPVSLQALIDLARQAGDKIMAIYATDFEVDTKDDQSPLTAADLASHHCIIDGLQALGADIPVLSEESAKIPYAERSQWNRYWLIDPLDGTKEFVKRNGEFTVNIALIDDGVPVMGVVYAPVLDVTYAAAEGQGAFKQVKDGDMQEIRVADADTPLKVVGSRSHRGELVDAFLSHVGEHEMVAMGSSLKICLVAEGAADIYPRLGPTSEWDTAAAHAVVIQAGGRLTDTGMADLRYNTKDSLLNPHFLVFGNSDHAWGDYVPAP